MTTIAKAKQAVRVKQYRPSARLGDAALYWLDPPVMCDVWVEGGEPFDYVVLSTRDGLTDVWPADNDGTILGWTNVVDLTAEQSRTHQSTLAAMGYEVTDWGRIRA